MNYHPTPLDTSQRREALNSAQSFIVQAPAGSGKTELLTQRFLTLLAQVEHPESILAITFTRKAAKEMIHRIQQALVKASNNPPPASEHEQHTYQLAKAALQNDQRHQWHLCDHIHKLNIMTIDSFCLNITQQMPIQSGLCKVAQISPNPFEDYHESSRQLLTLLEHDGPYRDDLITLLRHLDHQESHLIRLFNQLLATREQWLPILLRHKNNPSQSLRNHMQDTLKTLHRQYKGQIIKAIPSSLHDEISKLCAFAADNLTETDSPILACQSIKCLPTLDDSHETWLGMLHCFLTQDAQWRKMLDKRSGFPSSTDDKIQKAFWKSQKANMMGIIESLKAIPGLLALFQHCRQLPPQNISDPQWETLKALLNLLPALAAQCQIIFNQKGHVDYIEIASSALAALKHEDDVNALNDLNRFENDSNDVALSLHYQLQHILIDEFQDTSPQQYALVNALVADWSSSDEKTLFLVGDPMQSIYRFRQADVGLFLNAKDHGIGPVPLKYLALNTNFRSHPDLIAWINTHIGQLFSKKNHADDGAIAYAPSQSMPLDEEKLIESSQLNNLPEYLPGSAKANAIVSENPEDEVSWLIEQLQMISHDHPKESIAILVRARSHLPVLLKALTKANMPFQGIDLATLAEHPLSMDLQSLTLALCFPNHVLAWMSLLRGPLCGLSLDSLSEVQAHHAKHPWDKILGIETLSVKEDQSHWERFKNIMSRAISSGADTSIATVVHRVFIALGGPNLYPHDEGIFQKFIHVLNQLNDFSSPEKLTQMLRTESISQEQSAQIQIMTMHKAKGLEFDHVFLPFGHKQAPPKTQPLLLWQTNLKHSSLLMSPVSDRNMDADPLYHYLQFCESKKTAHELVRLLYVACTRAKKTLTLSCHSTQDDLKFHPSTFAYRLQALYHLIHFQSSVSAPEKRLEQLALIPEPAPPPLRHRIHADWQYAGSIDALFPVQAFQNEIFASTEALDSSNKRYIASIRGECLHQTLQSMGKLPKSEWSHDWLLSQVARWKLHLLASGLSDIKTQCDNMKNSIEKTMEDPNAQWILSCDHEEAESEWSLNHDQGEYTETLVLDRTFIHEGIRWIIDFKTTPVPSDNTSGFAHIMQQKHQAQLHRYAKALSAIDSRPIKCGLYFPDGNLWHSWDFLSSAS